MCFRFILLGLQVKQHTSGIVNKENVERNILTSLENLFNLSTPNEDYAMMAGDVAISAEILQFIIDYITKENQDDAHSSTEVKVRDMCVCCSKNKDLFAKCEVQMYSVQF